MLVCHCFAVFEGSVREAVSGGATTVDDISSTTGAGGGCGGCHPSLCRMLPDHEPGGCQGLDCSRAAVAELVSAVG